ncbi:LLM class flavin-dependent oxidoreductase [Amycolatopsis coloradensis]|uniref:LLM class flavin-dependent oxidoreductase n=1 Tax=Amycolatopsis coloradensis TaxID=76021 RepID=A0ACD5BJY3_9PSEU
MKLGVNIAPNGAPAVASAAERLGYDVAFVPEGYRTDAISVLGMLAGRTERIGLAAGVLQIPARSAVMTAMTASTLETLAPGRVRLGLGISNAHISEGWHGVRFDRPLRRTREYIEIVRLALNDEPVRYRGELNELPLPDARGEPFRQFGSAHAAAVPIYLAAIGPRSLELAGEVADGWFGVFCSPDRITESLPHIRSGRDKAGLRDKGFEVAPSVPVVVGRSPDEAADAVRHYIARFVSLGSKEHSFYHSLMKTMGYPNEADEVHDRYGAGDHAGAAAAVPFGFIDATALLGPRERIAEKMTAYAEAGVTTLALSPFARAIEEQQFILRVAAEALDRAGLA